MALNYYASSPVAVLPPQQPPAHYFANHHDSQQPPTPSAIAPGYASPSTTKRTIYKHPTPPSMNYQASTHDNRIAGRKRSRADIAEDDLPEDGSIIASEKPKPEPIYGPGMTLIYPDEPGLHISAESQTGTWREEKQDVEESTKSTERPKATARKSQRRLDTSAHTVEAVSVSPTHTEPIDTLGLLLGISWKRIPESQAIAFKGYQKFIERHYSFGNATFLLHNEAFQVYLVRTEAPTEAYRLFSEDLKQSHAVGFNEDEAIANLANKGVDEFGKPTYVYVEDPVVAFDTTPPQTPQTPPQTTPQTIEAVQSTVQDVEMEL